MKWQNKEVLITGAGGFIGSHLVDRLVNLGADVTAFVHYNGKNDWGMLEETYSSTLKSDRTFLTDSPQNFTHNGP